MMHELETVVPAGPILLIAAVCILPFPAGAATASTHRTALSAAALKELVPEGYKVEKTIACDPEQGARHEYLVALSEPEDVDIPERPVMLFLVAVGKKILVEDRVTLHNAGGADDFGPPNYFTGMTRENVGGVDLFLVHSALSAGGSGSTHYFDFYRPEKKKLRLVKSFSHSRMERTYFAVYKSAVYDADVHCSRGEKHGKAYVYTCYLQVTKYVFDGQAFHPGGSERLREQRGNQFLQDKYWFISVLKALQNNEIFKEAP
jgi:hypothetical protein